MTADISSVIDDAAAEGDEHDRQHRKSKPADARASAYDFSHDGLALDMGVGWRAEARHVALWGRWLFWNGSHWQQDDKLEHLTRTRAYLRQQGARFIAAAMAGKIPGLGEDDARKIAKALRGAPTIAAVASLVRSNIEMAAVTSQWDTDRMKLGGPQTIDLATGKASRSNPLDYITKTVAVAPAASGTAAPLWQAFLKRITGEDEELQGYLQRVAGYFLTGEIKEHVLFFLYGTGANGKSIFLNTLLWLLQDYAVTISPDMLMVSNNDRHPTEVARLRGARVAVGSEVEVDLTWAESKIKGLTGGDRLQGRFMRQDFFEFDPQFKLAIAGNNKPSLRGVDEAIRRRLHLIPFTVTIPKDERDEDLPEKLKVEGPAILRWAVDGCLEWQRRGLAPPESVREATDTYLAAENVFEQWRSECTTLNCNGWETSSDLWASWKAWAERVGEFVGTQRAFSNKLLDHGFKDSPQGSPKRRGFYGADLIRRDYSADTRYGS